MSDFLFRTGSDVQGAHPSWYRGETCHFNPTKNALHADGGLEEYILKGWVPPAPFITRNMPITAFGSCFAEHVSRWLMRSTSCSMIGPSSSSGVTKWQVAPMSFTPRPMTARSGWESALWTCAYSSSWR